MRARSLPTLLLGMAVLAPGPLAADGPEIPSHPDALSDEPIVFDPPSAADHRHVLDNGMVVFIAEDRALPLVEISITLRAGRWLDPPGLEGLRLTRYPSC